MSQNKTNHVVFTYQTSKHKKATSGLREAALAFLSDMKQEVRDAARGKQMLMFRGFVGHATCIDLDCETCASVMGSGLRQLQWVQNDAFGIGVFRASEDVRQRRLQNATEWAKAIKVPLSHKDFQNLPDWLQQEIAEYFHTQSQTVAIIKKSPHKESA